MRYMRRSLVGLVLLAMTIGLLAWAGLIVSSAVQTAMSEETRQRPARERVFAVNVQRLDTTSMTPELTVFGEVQSRRTLDIRASAAGRIVDLAEGFEDGAAVETGAFLARIDPAAAQSTLDRAKTDVLEAEAEMRDAGRALELAKDELTAAEDQAALQTRALDRQRDLKERGVGTDAAIETAELAASSSRQAVLSARQSLANAEARSDLAATSLSRQKINLAEAERGLADTEIRASFSGTLGEVSITQGGLVANNEQLAQLIDTSALEVAFRVSTAQYTRLLGDDGRLILAPVTVALEVFGFDLEATGQISRVSASVGEGQTGRLIFARIDDAKGFRPGDFVTVRVREPDVADVSLVPSSAVSADQEVLIVGDDERLETAQVRLLRRQGDNVIIDPQDAVGRDIVTQRSPLLGEGIKVRVLNSGGDGAEGAEQDDGDAMVELTPERRAKLVAFVEANKRMPEEAKARILSELENPQVRVQMVERIESRMGG